MPIDTTKPADGALADKADQRTNWQAAKDGIEPNVVLNSTTSFSANATVFPTDRLYARRLFTNASTITATLTNLVAVGCILELVRTGSGNINVVAGTGVTLLPTASTGNWPAGLHSTTDLYEALIYTVDAQVAGVSATWRQISRPPVAA